MPEENITVKFDKAISLNDWNAFRKKNDIESKEESGWLYNVYKPKMLGEEDNEKKQEKPFIEEISENYHIGLFSLKPETNVKNEITKFFIKLHYFENQENDFENKINSCIDILALLNQNSKIREIETDDLIAYYFEEMRYFPNVKIVPDNKEVDRKTFIDSLFKGVYRNLATIQKNCLENKQFTTNGNFQNYSFKMDIKIQRLKINYILDFPLQFLDLINVFYEEVANSIEFGFAINLTKQFGANNYEYNFKLNGKKETHKKN